MIEEQQKKIPPLLLIQAQPVPAASWCRPTENIDLRAWLSRG